MPKHTLNGHTFDAQPLKPFGLELTSSKPVDVVELAQKDLAAIVKATRKHLLLVIRNTNNSGKWPKVLVTPDHHSNGIWHTDSSPHGQTDVELFQAPGGQRKPTGFIHRPALARAVVKHREHLNPWVLNCPSNDPDIHSIEELYTMLKGQESDIRTSSIHQLYIALNQNDRIPKRSFFNFSGRKERERTIRMRRACAQVLKHFVGEVNRDPTTTYYIHNWTQKPDSTVISFNGTENDDMVVGHCRLPDTTVEHEESLDRKQLIKYPCGKLRLK